MSNRLLAIPNDSTVAYSRSDNDDFLSEFNPRSSRLGGRFFDSVAFLNWKDEVDSEYCGVKAYSFLGNKDDAYALVKGLYSGDVPFSAPLFESIFDREKDKIFSIAKRFNPSIVRAFNTHFAAELGYLVSRELGVPLVVSAHDPSRLTSAVKYANSLVSISQSMADICVEKYGVSRNNITIIPDGVDMDRLFFPRSKSEYTPVVGEGFDSNYKILSVGRVVPSKNIETLLRSIVKVKANVPGLKHIHLGNGEASVVSDIEGMRDSLGLGDSSFFLGGVQKNQLPFYYSWADVYALPTLYEGLGRAQIEALSCGTPVITTDDEPMNTIVNDGENGFVVDPMDSSSLAEKIEAVFLDDSLRSKMGGDNARISVSRFDVKKVMDANCDNYFRILSSH